MKLQKLMENPYAWAVLSICTIGALIFAIYTWVVGKKRKELSCFYNTFEIMKAGKNIVPKLKLLYEGNEIDDLTVTKYAIWNSGNEVLHWSDIVIAKSLKIISNENAKILDAKILVQSDETNIFKITDKQDNCINMNFDYVDVNDGIILQILHTGEASNLNVECKIKGGKKLRDLNHNAREKTEKKHENHKRDKLIYLIFAGILVLLMCVSYLLMVLAQVGIISIDIVAKIFFLDSRYNGMFTMLSFVILMVTLYCIMLKEFLYIGIPTKLKKNIGYDNFDNDLEIKNQ